MKKMTFIGLIWLTLLACQSQTKSYKIKGHIEGAGNGKAILIKNNGETQNTNGDTVKLRNGNFTFTGIVDEPIHAMINICPDNEKSAFINIIMENSLITISSNWDDVVDQYGYRHIPNCEVTGSLNDKVYREFNHTYEKLLQSPKFKEHAAALKKREELHKNGDKEVFYKYQEETESLCREIKLETEKRQKELIIQNHTVESAASCLFILQNDMEFPELEEIFNSLAPNVQNSSLAKPIKKEITAKRRIQPGQLAPDFTLETPDGAKLSLSDLRGKYVILDFWASWCRPCRASFPEMKKLYAEYKKKNVEILGITNDSQKADWLKALEEDQLPWLQVTDNFSSPNRAGKVATLYVVPYLPTLMLIDPDGKIVGKAKDKHELKEWLDARLAKK